MSLQTLSKPFAHPAVPISSLHAKLFLTKGPFLSKEITILHVVYMQEVHAPTSLQKRNMRIMRNHEEKHCIAWYFLCSGTGIGCGFSNCNRLKRARRTLIKENAEPHAFYWQLRNHDMGQMGPPKPQAVPPLTPENAQLRYKTRSKKKFWTKFFLIFFISHHLSLSPIQSFNLCLSPNVSEVSVFNHIGQSKNRFRIWSKIALLQVSNSLFAAKVQVRTLTIGTAPECSKVALEVCSHAEFFSESLMKIKTLCIVLQCYSLFLVGLEKV